MKSMLVKVSMIASLGVAAVVAQAEDPQTLTGSYLEGRWCYDSIDFGGQLEQVDIEYVFSADGTLSYQNNSGSSRMSDGRYELGAGRMKIMPSLTFFDFSVASVRDDGFDLEAMGGRHHFIRGGCN